jgi:hypothetical protein
MDTKKGAVGRQSATQIALPRMMKGKMSMMTAVLTIPKVVVLFGGAPLRTVRIVHRRKRICWATERCGSCGYVRDQKLGWKRLLFV